MAGLPFFNRRPAWMPGATAATTGWMESTLELARWESMRKSGRRWGWWGAALGALLGVIVYAPASLLSQAVLVMSDQRLLRAESQGTIWHGNAVAVLTGGAGSRDASTLPGRVNWTLHWQGLGMRLTMQQDCCMPTPVTLLIEPGWQRLKGRVLLQAVPDAAQQTAGDLGHWPASWLGGLGTPWNTLQLSGALRLSASDLSFEMVQGRLRLQGQASLSLDNVASRVTTLERLGSYRLDVSADPQGLVQLKLSTLDGALQLSGQGGVTSGGLHFLGEARASESERGALDNLLNIIGRRQGDRSVISIG